MVFFDRTQRRRRPRVDIVPLIDVMFILVAFFMLFTSFAPHEQSVPVVIPEMQTAENVTQASPIVITVTANGSYFLGNQPATLSEITEAVRREAAVNPGLSVYVRSDRNAPVGALTAAIDAARLGGANHFNIAAHEPEM